MNRTMVVLTIVGTVEQGVTLPELKNFARDAVSSWGGGLHPDDPLFGSVAVTHISAARVATVEVE